LRKVASNLVKSTGNPTEGIGRFEEKLSNRFELFWNQTRWSNLRSFWPSVSNAGKEEGRALVPCAEERDLKTPLLSLACRIHQLQ
jgi:hypothetical protein